MPIYVVTTYRVNGNDSLGVTFPKELRQQLGIKNGKKFIVKADEKSGTITLEPNE